MNNHSFWTLLTMVCWAVVLAADAVVAQSPPGTADYTAQIGPLLTKYCAGCHQGEEAEGQLSMETYDQLLRGGEHGPVVTPGSAASSRLVGVLTGRVEPRMPPEDEPAPTAEQIEQLVAWIDAGAPGPAGTLSMRPRISSPSLPPAATPTPITAVAFSPDGRSLAVARFGSVELKAVGEQVAGNSSLTLSQQRLKHPGKVLAVAFTSLGENLITASGIAGLYGEARLWNCADGKLLRTFPEDQLNDSHEPQVEGHRDILYAAVVSPDGRLLATSGYDHTIFLWELASGELIRRLTGHHGAVFDLAFTPDSARLASASADATIKLWRVSTGQRLDTRSEPLQGQQTTAISPDGQLLVAGGEDNRIRVWRLPAHDKPRNSPLLHSRFAHEGSIYQLRFSGDGRRLVSCGADGEVKLWDTSTFRQLHTWPNPAGSVQAVAISSVAGQVVVGRTDGSVQFHPLPELDDGNGEQEQQAEGQPPRTANHQATKDASLPWVFIPKMISSERIEREPNDTPDQAETVMAPARVRGAIEASGSRGSTSQESAQSPRTDVDFFRFHSSRGESWILEVRAQGEPASLDSHVEVLDAQGRSIPRVLLQAVRDSYFTFRGKDSDQTGDFRLHQWEEMRLNEFLYCNGEVVRLYHYPRGPDSGFNVYPDFGKRHGFFGTTPTTHALNEPCYIVQPHPPGTPMVPGGLPTFVLNYENDDQSQREWGSDSYLAFTAPHEGDFLVRVSDVRGQQGSDYHYELAIHPPQPDFKIRSVVRENDEISSGCGRKFGVELSRSDGFAGPVTIRFSDLPTGYSIQSPLVVPAGQYRAWGMIRASAEAPDLSSREDSGIRLIASARLAGREVQKWPVPFGKLILKPASKLQVELVPSQPDATRDQGMPVIEIVPGTTRTLEVRVERNGFEGPISFGKQDAAHNGPHGVYVDNIGLNGVLIPPGEHQRTITLTAEPWVEHQERIIFLAAEQAGRPTSNPVLLRVVRGEP